MKSSIAISRGIVLLICLGAITVLAPAALAGGDDGPGLGDRIRLQTQDRLHDGSCTDDCCLGTPLSTQTQLQTRTQLRDCDAAPAAGDGAGDRYRYWNRWQNREMDRNGETPSAALAGYWFLTVLRLSI